MIPILKELYEELSDQLELVYISIDDKSTVYRWTDLIKREQIPWRSLLLMEDRFKIRNEYTIQTIPALLLVYPGAQKAEILVERDKEPLKKALIK